MKKHCFVGFGYIRVVCIVICLSILTCSPAFAAKQLYGETMVRGPRQGYTFAEMQAAANFYNIYTCEEFQLYAHEDVSKSGAYIRCNVYSSETQGSPGSRQGIAEFSQNLSAGAKLFFPAAGQYKRVVSSSHFDVESGLYYRTMLYTNMPNAITGVYRGWISTLRSGN